MASVSFGPYRLDLETGELRRSGIAVKLQAQPSKLLTLLVERAGELVTRDEIRRRVWGTDTFVDFDQSVNFCIRQIRAALHDSADRPCYVETVPRKGYRFIAPIQRDSDRPDDASAAAAASVALARGRQWRLLAIASAVLVIVAAAAGSSAFKPSLFTNTSLDNPKARQEIELGRFFLNKFSASGAQAAIEHFEAAAKEDPENAAAYAGLADAYNQLGTVFIAVKPPTNVRLLALGAATRAIQLNPNLAEAYAALGYTMLHELDWTGAETALRRAIELNPRYMPAHQAYASYLAAQRRFAEAIDEARRGLDLEPASVRARQVLAWMLYFDRQYDAAARELRTILNMDRTYALAHFRLGQVFIVTARWDEAISSLQTAVEMTDRAPAALGLLAMAYGGRDQRAEAQRIVGELEGRAVTQNVPPGALLLAYIGVDDKTRAIDMIERGYAERDNYEINIVADPLMDPLRGETRFQAICRQVMRGTRRQALDILTPKTSPVFH
jgi:DNA-binding winged helix-turn-helix (wHTH) protein/Tfp pilus assembly protein PilF